MYNLLFLIPNPHDPVWSCTATTIPKTQNEKQNPPLSWRNPFLFQELFLHAVRHSSTDNKQIKARIMLTAYWSVSGRERAVCCRRWRVIVYILHSEGNMRVESCYPDVVVQMIDDSLPTSIQAHGSRECQGNQLAVCIFVERDKQWWVERSTDSSLHKMSILSQRQETFWRTHTHFFPL